MAAFLCFYNLTFGPMPKLNGAWITLLQKKEVVELPSNYTSINLIHSFAKLISKVLAMRLAPHINKLVSHAQSAFIKGRCIQKKFLCVRNLARAYHQKKVSALLLKLDIVKAYLVSWQYIIEMLEHRGFLARWRNWLALLLSTSSSSVRMNGIQGPWIKHMRGLRQGDPLSPYLFILVIDTMQHILQRSTEEGLLTPLRDRVARVRLSLYANDAALFLNPTKQDVDNTMEIMRRFGNATGLCMNMEKSAVLPIRCGQINLDEALQNITRERAFFPIIYLGLPITIG
jgi:hypothetical protein